MGVPKCGMLEVVREGMRERSIIEMLPHLQSVFEVRELRGKKEDAIHRDGTSLKLRKNSFKVFRIVLYPTSLLLLSSRHTQTYTHTHTHT